MCEKSVANKVAVVREHSGYGKTPRWNESFQKAESRTYFVHSHTFTYKIQISTNCNNPGAACDWTGSIIRVLLPPLVLHPGLVRWWGQSTGPPIPGSVLAVGFLAFSSPEPLGLICKRRPVTKKRRILARMGSLITAWSDAFYTLDACSLRKQPSFVAQQRLERDLAPGTRFSKVPNFVPRALNFPGKFLKNMLSSCGKSVISLPKWSCINQKVMARASSSSFIKIPSIFGSKTSKTADVREEKQATPVRKEYYVPRKFVPMTRKALIRRIVEDKKLVNPTDRHYFQGLAEVLDKSIAGTFHAALGELKVHCKNILTMHRYSLLLVCAFL